MNNGTCESVFFFQAWSHHLLSILRGHLKLPGQDAPHCGQQALRRQHVTREQSLGCSGICFLLGLRVADAQLAPAQLQTIHLDSPAAGQAAVRMSHAQPSSSSPGASCTWCELRQLGAAQTSLMAQADSLNIACRASHARNPQPRHCMHASSSQPTFAAPAQRIAGSLPVQRRLVGKVDMCKALGAVGVGICVQAHLLTQHQFTNLIRVLGQGMALCTISPPDS